MANDETKPEIVETKTEVTPRSYRAQVSLIVFAALVVLAAIALIVVPLAEDHPGDSLGIGDGVVGAGTLLLALGTGYLGLATRQVDKHSAERERARLKIEDDREHQRLMNQEARDRTARENQEARDETARQHQHERDEAARKHQLKGVARLISGELWKIGQSYDAALRMGVWTDGLLLSHPTWDRDAAILIADLEPEIANFLITLFLALTVWELEVSSREREGHWEAETGPLYFTLTDDDRRIIQPLIVDIEDVRKAIHPLTDFNG